MTLNEAIDKLPNPLGEALSDFSVERAGAITVTYTPIVQMPAGLQTWQCTLNALWNVTYINKGTNLPDGVWPAAEQVKAPDDEKASWAKLMKDVIDHEAGHHTTGEGTAAKFKNRPLTASGQNAAPAPANKAKLEAHKVATADMKKQVDALLSQAVAADDTAQAAYHVKVGASIDVSKYKIR